MLRRYLSAAILALTLAPSPSFAGGGPFYVVDRCPTNPNTGFLNVGMNTPCLTPDVVPSAVLSGTLPAPGQIGEVAVTQAVLAPGDLVPLPQYADGTQAAEGEIFWTAHLWYARWIHALCSLGEIPYETGDRVDYGFSGRALSVSSVLSPNILNCFGHNGFAADEVRVLVTVIAVRQSGPTPAALKSWGQVKSIYR